MNKNTKNNDICIELKNIQYKSMLHNGINTPQETKSSSDLQNLDKFLEDEKNNNTNENWCKLNKNIKIKKLYKYTEKYKEIHNLTDEEIIILKSFFKDCLDRKKLQKIKEVIYDKNTGEIKDIPILVFNKEHNRFTLKNISAKHISTMKTLTPIKKKIYTTSTQKNIISHISNDDVSDNEEIIE